jgi:argininosuccinate lyase
MWTAPLWRRRWRDAPERPIERIDRLTRRRSSGSMITGRGSRGFPGYHQTRVETDRAHPALQGSSRMSTLWSGRFDAAPDALVFDFGSSFRFDRRLFEDDVRGSLAWAEALRGAGVLSAEDAAALRTALEDLLAHAQADPSFVSGDDEDVHTFVERQLIERVGEAGRRLHTGRSRNEQVSLDLRLYLRRRIPALQAALRRVMQALVTLAERCGPAVMPAYTHLRRAQPVLIAHFLLAHAAAFRRDHARLTAAADEADALTLGSGAVAGTNYGVDTARLAERLGFSRVVANSIDASSDRDFVSAFLHACALTMIHVSRFAEDVIIFSGEEHAFFELSDAASTGSSMMPQKKNPDPLELVRGKSGRVSGRLSGWLTTMKGLPSGYNKDLQEDKEAVFDAEDTLAGCLQAVAIVIEGLTVNTDRAGRAASGLLLATDVADYLVSRGLPFRRAHELVGGMTRRLLAEGRGFESLSYAEWRQFSELFGEDIVGRITAHASVEARRTPQSTGPNAVAAAIGELQAWLAQAAVE